MSILAFFGEENCAQGGTVREVAQTSSRRLI